MGFYGFISLYCTIKKKSANFQTCDRVLVRRFEEPFAEVLPGVGRRVRVCTWSNARANAIAALELSDCLRSDALVFEIF